MHSFETANCYKVLGENPYMAAQGRPGGQIGKAYEQSDCCMRQCCGPRRPFEMRILCEYSDFGMGEDQDCIHIDRPWKFQSPCCCNLQEICVSKLPNNRDADRKTLGYVKEQCSCTGAAFTVEDGSGSVVFTIEGPCCPCDGPCCTVEFPVMQGETQVGMLTKEKDDWMVRILPTHFSVDPEAFALTGALLSVQVGMVSDADTFSLTFPQGCSTEIKAVLLGAVFLIDFMCELLRAPSEPPLARDCF